MNIDAVLDTLNPAGFVKPCPFTEDTRGKPKVAHCCDGYGNPSSAGTWTRCGAHWPNHEALNHCPTCHLTFASLASFDAHRVGPYNATRTCLPMAHLVDNDWTNTPGNPGMADTWTAPAKGKK